MARQAKQDTILTVRKGRTGMDEERNQEMTKREDVVVVKVGDMIREGLHVMDVNSVKIGAVHRYDLHAGYLVVEHGVLVKQRFYVPFHLMRSITPKEISLAVSKAALANNYYLPPIMKPVVEEMTNPLTGHVETVILHELRSGYDGRPVRIKPVSVEEVMTRITVGMTVVDVEEDYVGEIIDRDGDLLTVKDNFADTFRSVSVGMVQRVDPHGRSVTLLVPKIALQSYTLSHEISAQVQAKDADTN
jgi:hypothetical protein